MTSVVDKYYRKISENIDNIKMKFDISSLLVKSKEHDNKIENIYDKDYIDDNFLIESEIDKKDNAILNNINNHIQEVKNNYLIKGNTYDKTYINDNYYNKSELNNNFNNLYNRTYLDNKFDNIYNKNEINEKTSKLDRNIVLFNQNLTNFIDETYKNDKKI